ncbi:MAG: DegQ family serine endoprotease [FCB group bacterium]|nr:DegQ family serine endoprotease [FCB group bacterium]
MNKTHLKLVIVVLVIFAFGYMFLPSIHSITKQPASATAATTASASIASTSPAVSIEDRPLTTLRDLNQAFADIASTVKPTVVTVFTEKTLRIRQNPFFSPFFFDFFNGPQGHNNIPEQNFHQRGLGSGVIIASDGKIITNNHVIDGADSIYVRTYDKHKYLAKVIGADPKTDIAIIKIDAKNLPVIKIGNSDSLLVGEMVMAIGSPMSENLAYTITQGIVSAKGRSNLGLADYEDYIQTDAAINPGNSGGALVNLNGELVGINAAIVTKSGGFQGIGFAVPVNMAMNIMNSLLKNGKVVRGWLGVTIQDINDAIANAMNLKEHNGALVGDVLANSPADKAGMKAGDIIIKMDGENIPNSSLLRNKVASTAPGTKVNFTVLRDGKEVDLSVRLGEIPSKYSQGTLSSNLEDLLGFQVSNFSNALAKKYNLDPNLNGVVVTQIDPNSQAYMTGLREGDLIRSVNKRKVDNVENFNKSLKGFQKGDTILLRIQRGESGFYIAFTL